MPEPEVIVRENRTKKIKESMARQDSMLEGMVAELNDLIGNKGKVAIHRNDIGVDSDGVTRLCYIKQKIGMFQKKEIAYFELPCPDQDIGMGDSRESIYCRISKPEVFAFIQKKLVDYARHENIDKIILERV
jgi:hypothetical protein